jgi:hypothetical protein
MRKGKWGEYDRGVGLTWLRAGSARSLLGCGVVEVPREVVRVVVVVGLLVENRGEAVVVVVEGW